MRCNTKKKKERKEVGEEDEKEGEKQARQQTKGSPTQGNGGWGSGLMMMKRTGRAGWIVMANRSVGLRCKKTGGFLSSFFFFFHLFYFPSLSSQKPPYTIGSVPYLPSPLPSMYWEGLTEDNFLRIEPWNPECTLPSCESMIPIVL